MNKLNTEVVKSNTFTRKNNNNKVCYKHCQLADSYCCLQYKDHRLDRECQRHLNTPHRQNRNAKDHYNKFYAC